jgi:hypothetical protein
VHCRPIVGAFTEFNSMAPPGKQRKKTSFLLISPLQAVCLGSRSENRGAETNVDGGHGEAVTVSMDGMDTLRLAAETLELEEVDLDRLREHQEGVGRGRRERKLNSKYANDVVDHHGHARSLPSPKDHDAAHAGHSSSPSAHSDKHKVAFCGQL